MPQLDKQHCVTALKSIMLVDDCVLAILALNLLEAYLMWGDQHKESNPSGEKEIATILKE